MVRAGVTTVVSAGNEARDAATNAPASYDEVITVSAITDCDGVPGGLDRDGKCAQNPDYCFHQHDDTPASFTSFGADVDLIAPGVCVFSLWPFDFAGQPDPDGYNILSGTSMSAPHVTGAAALYKSRHPHASPAQVRATLIAAGSFNYDGSWDPDGIKEPLLNMASL
jgi:subtilisin family serine protease